MGGFLILAIFFIVVLFKISVNPKIKRFLRRAKDLFVWNWLIRYFQVSYLDMQSASLK